MSGEAKIVVVGDGACGKTCLLEVFKCDQFPEEYVPTVVDNFVKTVDLGDGRKIELALWDTAGQEDYDTIRPLSYRETDLVIMCYTIDNKKNLSNIPEKWISEIRNFCPNTNYFLVGLKKDLRETSDEIDHMVTYEEGKKVADDIGAINFFEVSALTRENVDEMFMAASREVANNKRAGSAENVGCCACLGG